MPLFKSERKKSNLNGQTCCPLVRRWEENDSLSDIDTVFVLKNFYGVEWEDLLLQDGEKMEKREEIAKPCASRPLDRTDILLLLSMVGCVLLFVGLFVFAWLNPVYWKTYFSVPGWLTWYINIFDWKFWIFRLFLFSSIIGFILSLNEYLKKR